VKTDFKTRVWFFDLDNTLHDASHRIFGEMNRAMTAWVVANLAIDADEADRLRTDYWQRYGTTLLGLIRHHAIDAHAFLRATHSFIEEPGIGELVRAERGLTELFRRLPGRKVLLTNAPAIYAERVLKEIGLSRVVRRRYHIEQMRLHGRFRPKPSRSMLRMLLAKEHVLPAHAVLIEDNLANLKSARAIGMWCVHVRGYDRRAQRVRASAQQRCLSGIGLRVESVTQLIRRRRFLR
jgi:putative hydrolase of the HAD superfamily